MQVRFILSGIVLIIAIFTGIIFYNTINIESKQILSKTKPPLFHPKYNEKELAIRLSGAIKIPTISYDERTKNSNKELLELHNYLESLYPLTYNELTLYKLGTNNLSLLFEWKGSYYNTKKDKPLLLSSHLDVVPVPENTLHKWSVDPFGGLVDDKFIWGRGTIDDKQGVLSILEATEWLLSIGHKPKNSIYLGFGHDEEISGFMGAKYIAQWFKDHNINIEYLVDEGLTILKDTPLPIDEVAFIGLAEKGSLEVEIEVRDNGGHSSLSTKQTAIDILSKALIQIYENPMPMRFEKTSPFHLAFEYLAPEISNFIFKAVFSNLWFFDPLVSFGLTFDPLTTVAVRTTAATTMINGGTKSNVLPNLATAVVNHRVIPGDTIQSVLDHDKNVINDPRVTVRPRRGENLEPSPVSSETSDGYNILAKTIRETFNDITVAPSLFVANTDTRHFWDIAKDIYRFCPTILLPSDYSRFHGIDERIGIHNYFQIIQFYYQLIKNNE